MKIAAALLALTFPAGAFAAPLPKPASFVVCGVCHKVEAGAPSGIGPNLWGVGGRVSGTLAGYAYSPAMKAAKIKWDKKSLGDYIANPQGRVPGNKMTYAGQKDPILGASIADYLMSLK